jgi:hypothetical protein
VIRVACLSRDVVIQGILEETHLYEFNCYSQSIRCGLSLDTHEKARKCDLYASIREDAPCSLVSVKGSSETHLI